MNGPFDHVVQLFDESTTMVALLASALRVMAGCSVAALALDAMAGKDNAATPAATEYIFRRRTLPVISAYNLTLARFLLDEPNTFIACFLLDNQSAFAIASDWPHFNSQRNSVWVFSRVCWPEVRKGAARESRQLGHTDAPVNIRTPSLA